MRSTVILILLVSCSFPAQERQAVPAPAEQSVELVDCNYYWPMRNRHVCIKDMPISECEDLFYVPGFQRESECYCDVANREKNRIEGSDYVQYDCE